MKLVSIIGLLLFFVGINANAITCRIKGGAENSYEGYDVILKSNAQTVEVVTQGAGWEFTYDGTQSNSITKYWSYKDLVVIYEMERISLYDYRSEIYYFQSEYCILPIEPKKAPPPAGYKPGGQSNQGHHNGGAVALPGGQYSPLPPGPDSSYAPTTSQFSPKRQVYNPRIHGIACDYDSYLRATVCDTNNYYVVVHHASRVELTFKKTGSQYMIPFVNTKDSCGFIGGFCEQLYTYSGMPFTVGTGSTNGIQLYIIGDNRVEEHSYEFPNPGY